MVRPVSATAGVTTSTPIIGRVPADVAPEVRLVPLPGGHLAGAVSVGNLVSSPTSLVETTAG